jgi:two-component system nitrate/nitrite response regulator NarL
MNDTIKVVIVDDYVLYRETVVEVLSSDPEIAIIGQGASAQEAIHLTADLHPDIILLDLGMPGGGLTAAWALASDFPATRIIVLTSSASEDDEFQATQAGVCAYLLKGVVGRELIQEIHKVYVGECLDQAKIG